MNKQTINQLNSYYKKCVETDYTNVNFEKLIIATCVLISEARLNCNFPSGIEKTCLLIEQKIEKLMHLKGVKSEHLHLAAKIFSEIAQHKFPAQTTVEHYLIATLDALGLKWNSWNRPNKSIIPENCTLRNTGSLQCKVQFCEYDSLSRKGEKMSDENIMKIISDLSSIHPSRNVQIQPYKISEPFLEKRLPWIVDEI